MPFEDAGDWVDVVVINGVFDLRGGGQIRSVWRLAEACECQLCVVEVHRVVVPFMACPSPTLREVRKL